MVGVRQRLARKCYKEANPELFPKPEPTPPKIQTRRRTRTASSSANNQTPMTQTNPRNHRTESILSELQGRSRVRAASYAKHLTTLPRIAPRNLNRKGTRFVCPVGGVATSLRIAQNFEESTFGETGHSLAKCPQPLQDGGTRYAYCFICNKSGHLSKDYLENTNGIYPKGGCYKICGGVTHLARDCPNKHSKIFDGAGTVARSFYEWPNRITKFARGDDLEDDFVSALPLDGKNKDVKTKTKQGPKVVNFVA